MRIITYFLIHDSISLIPSLLYRNAKMTVFRRSGPERTFLCSVRFNSQLDYRVLSSCSGSARPPRECATVDGMLTMNRKRTR